MSKNKVINILPPYNLQRKIETDTHRFRVIACGRRWGKTLLAMRETFRTIQDRYNKTRKTQRGWVVAPTFPLVREDWLTAETLLKDAITNKRETQMRMDFKPFGFLEFKSADRGPDGLIGAGLDCCVVDEASRVSRESWEQGLRPALADKQGKAIFISTPKGRNWFYEMWLKGQVENKEIKSWKHATFTNPFFPIEESEAIKHSTPELIYKQEYLADFLEDSASVFKNITSCLRGELEGNLEENYTIGVDLGKAEDFTVITVIRDYTCQVVNILRMNKIDWSLQKKQILNMCELYKRSLVYVDSTGLGDPIEEDLRKSGVNTRSYKFTNQSKQELIEQLIVAIEQGMIGIPVCRKTDFLIEELKAFTYEMLPSGRIRYTAPEGLHDDGVISLGLAVRGIQNKLYRIEEAKKQFIPFHSPAWLELESRDEELKRNALLPRRYRRELSELTFS